MNIFNKNLLIDNKTIKFCGRTIHKVRRIRPAFWLVILLALLVIFVTFVPLSFWKALLSGLKVHRFLLGMLILFCLLAVSLVWSAGERIDTCVFSFFNMHGRRPHWLDLTMLLVTELGNVIITFAIAVILYFFVSHSLAYRYVLGTLVLWLIVELMKLTIRRIRPYIMLTDVRVVGVPARGKSFPSGHTSQAFYTATMLTQYFNVGIMVAFPLYFLSMLVGVTRMYIGMHYPRDVLAGAILGTFWGFMGVIMNNYIFH